MKSPNCCPLTGIQGSELRRRNPSELAASYLDYFGTALPEKIVKKYFLSEVTEYYLESSGLRWYAPGELGDGEYYETLAAIYPWYYNPGTWDKQVALELMIQNKPAQVIEIGSGSGWFLAELGKRNIRCLGVEINAREVKASREQGLAVYFPEDVPINFSNNDWLCLFQTIEHVNDPAGFLNKYVQQFRPAGIVISAPCFESVLGRMKDPLSWPPHHFTAWSSKAFDIIAQKLGYQIVDVKYSPLSFWHFENLLKMEGTRKLPGLPSWPRGRLGRYLFRICQIMGFNWACRGHSILVVMTAKTPLPAG